MEFFAKTFLDVLSVDLEFQSTILPKKRRLSSFKRPKLKSPSLFETIVLLLCLAEASRLIYDLLKASFSICSVQFCVFVS